MRRSAEIVAWVSVILEDYRGGRRTSDGAWEAIRQLLYEDKKPGAV